MSLVAPLPVFGFRDDKSTAFIAAHRAVLERALLDSRLAPGFDIVSALAASEVCLWLYFLLAHCHCSYIYQCCAAHADLDR